MVTLEKIGSRVYFVGASYDQSMKIKGDMGAKWDEDRRERWVGVAKYEDAKRYVENINRSGQSVTTAERKPDDPHKIELRGKAEYKGKTYYMGKQSSSGTKVRLLTLPDDNDGFLDFWADVNQVTITKRYQSRQRWNGRYGRGSQQEDCWSTLGSVSDYIRDQKKGKANNFPQCAACGKHSNHLIRDLEDGLEKCKSCCDIPSE